MMAAAIPGHQEIDHDAGDAGLPVAGVLLDDGGQPVLFLELLPSDLLAVEHAGADDRPVMTGAGVEQIVEIDRLVRAMEIADAEMHDAGRQRGAIVFRRSDAWWGDSPRVAAESFVVMTPYFHCRSGRQRPASPPP